MGVANLISSFFLSMPAFGSLTRSAVADAAGIPPVASVVQGPIPEIRSKGAKTQMYQVVVAAIVLSTILFLQPLFYYLPKAVLSSIIIVAAFGTSTIFLPFDGV